ncbi:MAG: DUF167 domain-containing protein [Nanoarchaeota archaeon]
MIIKLKAHPNAKKQALKKLDDNNYEIWIKKKPIENKANIELIKLLQKYFKKQVNIKSGLTSRNKIIEIID